MSIHGYFMHDFIALDKLLNILLVVFYSPGLLILDKFSIFFPATFDGTF